MKTKFDIKSYLGTLLFTCECESLRDAVVTAVKSRADLSRAYLSGANLSRANLSGANLRWADLREANLRGAGLRWADLRGANLRAANLRGADLSEANLREADLSGAYLSGASLSRANLSGANLSGATLDDSAEIEPNLTWKQYQDEVVPALLTAGGKALVDVVSESWECHDWTNCPMAIAFGVHDLETIPALYRERARQFIQFFDAKMLKKPIPEGSHS